jgi:hypothetical protein
MEVVAPLSEGHTATAQCGLFTHKSVPVIFEPPCIHLEDPASTKPVQHQLHKCNIHGMAATVKTSVTESNFQIPK